MLRFAECVPRFRGDDIFDETTLATCEYQLACDHHSVSNLAIYFPCHKHRARSRIQLAVRHGISQEPHGYWPPGRCLENVLAMQPTMTRHARHQIFHLIGQDVAILQNEMFMAIRGIGNIKQFHPRLFRCAIGFAMIARAARGDDVDPIVATAF